MKDNWKLVTEHSPTKADFQPTGKIHVIKMDNHSPGEMIGTWFHDQELIMWSKFDREWSYWTHWRTVTPE